MDPEVVFECVLVSMRRYASAEAQRVVIFYLDVVDRMRGDDIGFERNVAQWDDAEGFLKSELFSVGVVSRRVRRDDLRALRHEELVSNFFEHVRQHGERVGGEQTSG